MMRRKVLHPCSLTVPLFLVAVVVSMQVQAAPQSYVIQTQQQGSAGQPYLRGISNQMLNVTIGRGSAKATYLQMIDSGSSLLSLPCSTAGSKQRKCNTFSGMYKLPTSALLSEAMCKANTTGCFAPSPSTSHGSCSWSSALTGGSGYNIYTGVFGTDTVSLPGSVGKALSWPGIFACFDSFTKCPENNGTACEAPYVSCPPGPAPRTCPYGNGLEAGMLFGQNSITTQMVNSGLIEKAVGFCYLPPAKNTNCSAPPIYNTSRVVLGSGRLPNSIPSLASMQSEPLIIATYPSNPPNGTTEPVFPEFRTVPLTASMASYGNATPSVLPVDGTTILWDTGAFSQSMVPHNVFNAFSAYFTAALAEINITGKIIPCGGVMQVQSLCGNNFYQVNRSITPAKNISVPAPSVCNMIQLPAGANASQISAAENMLMKLFPPTLNITMQHGGVASLPTAFIVHNCNQASTPAVAACSFMAPSSVFWLASPWFNNHFTLFDMAAPDPRSNTSVGTMYWAPVSDCTI